MLWVSQLANIWSDDDTSPADSALAYWGPLSFNSGKLVGDFFLHGGRRYPKDGRGAAGFVDIQTSVTLQECSLGQKLRAGELGKGRIKGRVKI